MGEISHPDADQSRSKPIQHAKTTDALDDRGCHQWLLGSGQKSLGDRYTKNGPEHQDLERALLSEGLHDEGRALSL